MSRMKVFCYVLILALCVPMVAVAAGGGGYRGGDGAVVTEPVPEPEAPVDDGGGEDSDRPPYAGPDATEPKPGTGNEEPGIARGDLYGDLYVVVRNANGAPIGYVWTWEFAADGETLVQPLSFEAAVDGGFPQPIADAALVPADWPWWDGDIPLVPTDPEGHVPDAYAYLTQEVEIGRLNVARAGAEVVDNAYDEAIASINGALAVSLDPAGRVLLTLADGTEKTIDSPRENLALYREIMRNGFLPGLTRTDMGPLEHLRVKGDGSDEIDPADLYRAACLFAGAADKFGDITLDMVIYVNNFLGINDPVAGAYFDFRGYTYNRGPAYAGVEPELLDDPVYIDGRLYFGLRNRSIMAEVFGGQDYPVESDVVVPGAREFTKASDDSVHTIWFIHNWAVPEYTLPE